MSGFVRSYQNPNLRDLPQSPDWNGDEVTKISADLAHVHDGKDSATFESMKRGNFKNHFFIHNNRHRFQAWKCETVNC